MPKITPTLTALGAAFACVSMLAIAPKVSREGDAARREKLAALEAKPFPAESLTTLTDWVGGEPVTAETFASSGVVAFAYVDSANSASMTVLNRLTRLARENAEKGLRVFAVHPESGWDRIEQLGGDDRIRVPVAKDTGGKFREAMGVDDDPDLYLVDRAGLLRYADIESRSLESAVAALLRETAETAAANAAKETDEQGASGDEEESKTDKAPRPGATPVDPAEYAKASWPAHNTGELYAADFQGRQPPVPLGGEWITEEQDTAGKVIIVDFWATWCGPCRAVMPTLDELQRTYKDDVLVLGMAGQPRPGYPEDRRAIETFMRRQPHSYAQLIDPQQGLYKALGVRGIPHVIVLSTDGVIRWQGFPMVAEFRDVIEQIVQADPGLARNQDD